MDPRTPEKFYSPTGGQPSQGDDFLVRGSPGLFVGDSPSIQGDPNLSVPEEAQKLRYASSDGTSDDEPEMEDVVMTKVEEMPDDVEVRVKQEVADEVDPVPFRSVFGPLAGEGAHGAQAEKSPEIPRKASEAEVVSPAPRMPDVDDPTPQNTPATLPSGPPSIATPSFRGPSVRYTLRNEQLSMTFSSKVMRPFKKAMEAFCERAGTGTSVDGVRWVFEEARVQPHDTPQSVRLVSLDASCEYG